MLEALVGADLALLDGIAQHCHNGFLDVAMPFFSDLGNYGFIWIALGLALLCLPRERRGGVCVLLALLCSLVICNLLLKNLVCRPRPFDVVEGIALLVPPPTDWSFPSGHTSASFAAAVALLRSGKRWGWAALALAVVIAFSRLYLYVHFPSDVLGGALVGVLSGLLACWLWPRLERLKGGRTP